MSTAGTNGEQIVPYNDARLDEMNMIEDELVFVETIAKTVRKESRAAAQAHVNATPRTGIWYLTLKSLVIRLRESVDLLGNNITEEDAEPITKLCRKVCVIEAAMRKSWKEALDQKEVQDRLDFPVEARAIVSSIYERLVGKTHNEKKREIVNKRDSALRTLDTVTEDSVLENESDPTLVQSITETHMGTSNLRASSIDARHANVFGSHGDSKASSMDRRCGTLWCSEQNA